MHPKPIILVTGANGQLGRELRSLAPGFTGFEFIFTSHEELAIERFKDVDEFFDKHQPDFCINCAAYTAVDAAEEHAQDAFRINADAVSILADLCDEHETKFLHISTDYVFDGSEATPYTEESPTAPVNVYGASKLAGENLAAEMLPETIVIRTSWVYSSYGKNFVKTMLRLMREKTSIKVVSDQIGSPTYAEDLASMIMKIIIETMKNKEAWVPGIYHFSNEGIISWFEFAQEIKKLSASNCEIIPIPTSEYPTPAKRPLFSVLNKARIQKQFGVTLQNWKDSLSACLQKIEETAS
jgi:dTDP-4-dehydrorhamnose reductase